MTQPRRRRRPVVPEPQDTHVVLLPIAEKGECASHGPSEPGQACPNCGKCTARSARTGKPCRQNPIKGGNVCLTHGGSAPQAKKAAALRLLALADPAITALAKVVRDTNTSDADRIRAATAILDRAGLGPSAKIETGTESYHGFLAAVVRKGGTVDRSTRYDRRTVPIDDDDEDE